MSNFQSKNRRDDTQKSAVVIPSDLGIIEPEKIVEITRDSGRLYAERRITTSQIRNIFSRIISIRTDYKKNNKFNDKIKRDLILLKPLLAYAKGRKNNVEPLQKLLFDCIDGVVGDKVQNKEAAMENFFAIVEGIVAFHKFYGGN